MFLIYVLISINKIWKKSIERKQGKAKINNNNDNNNLILRSQPSQAPKWCMRTTCLWDKGPPLHSNLTAKVYRGVYTLPHSSFEQYDV